MEKVSGCDKVDGCRTERKPHRVRDHAMDDGRTEMVDLEVERDPKTGTANALQVVGTAGAQIDDRVDRREGLRQAAKDVGSAEVTVEAPEIAQRAIYVCRRRVV